jgi:signal transduction histidine kinase
MRISLRWKILLLAVLTPAMLGLATLLTVSRNVTAHVNSSSIHESLEHSVAVFESMLRTRSRALAGGAHVIAQDPRFFSLLMLGPAQRDSRFTATVRSMARDFNRITQTDLFEVVDRRGRVLASVGPASSSRPARESLTRAALRGQTLEGILVERDAHYQAALAPVFADGQIVGVLLLGVRIGPSLARELRSEMRCEVTFLSGATVTGTTLQRDGDRAAMLRELGKLDLSPAMDLRKLGVQTVRAPHMVYLTLVRRIPGSDPAARQLYVMQRAFDPETSFLHLMRKDMLVLAVIALIAALVTGLLFSEEILRPLQRLVKAAQEMEKGNYHHPVRIRRRDEIGYLAHRFVEMRQRERAYLDSLEHAMQLKSRFLGIASHVLRTPISVLTGYRDLLAGGALGPVTEDQRQALDAMHASLASLTNLTEEAARFAQVTGERLALDFRPCDVAAIVHSAVMAARIAGAGRAVRVEARCEAMSRPVEADGESLERAILNLITNGIRFTPDDGLVEVRAREIDGNLRIEVKDSGVGIPEDRLNALLSTGLPTVEINNYRSATGLEFQLPGLGLGLPIARGIVEAHRGTIRVESRVGEGSTFVIEMPMTRDRGMRAAA